MPAEWTLVVEQEGNPFLAAQSFTHGSHAVLAYWVACMSGTRTVSLTSPDGDVFALREGA